MIIGTAAAPAAANSAAHGVANKSANRGGDAIGAGSCSVGGSPADLRVNDLRASFQMLLGAHGPPPVGVAVMVFLSARVGARDSSTAPRRDSRRFAAAHNRCFAPGSRASVAQGTSPIQINS